MRVMFIIAMAVLLFGCIVPEESKDQPNETIRNITIAQITNNGSANATPANTTQPQNTTNTSSTAASPLPEPACDFSDTYTGNGKLIVYFFHSTGCPACSAVAPYVEEIGKKYEETTEWRGYDLTVRGEWECYQKYYEEFNLTWQKGGTPQILVNNTILWGQFEIRDNLEGIINGSTKS